MSMTESPSSLPISITVGVGQLRSNVAGILSQIATGATVFIKRRGRIVASIVGIPAANNSDPMRNTTPVSLASLRSCAGQWLDRAGRGEIVDIIDRGQAVASILHYPSG